MWRMLELEDVCMLVLVRVSIQANPRRMCLVIFDLLGVASKKPNSLLFLSLSLKTLRCFLYS